MLDRFISLLYCMFVIIFQILLKFELKCVTQLSLKKGQAVGARMAGALVTRTAEMLGFSRATISNTIKKFKKHGKTSSNRSNSGRTSKHTNRDRRALKHIVRRNHPNAAARVTAESSQYLNSPVSTRLSASAFYYQHSDEVEVV